MWRTDYKMKKHILSLLLVIATSFAATAQKNPYDRIKFSRHGFVDTVKIKIWNGAVIIPVEINGEIKDMMFDTGSPCGLWIGNEEEWMALSGDSLLVSDAQKTAKMKSFMLFPPMKMGEITIENYPMMVDDAIRDYICDKFDGVLGYDIVARGLSFKFDTKDSLMIVTDRKRLFSKEEKRRPKLKYKWYHKTNPKIWVKLPFSRIKLQFDSGSIGGWIDLPEDLATLWGLDDYTVRRDTTILTHAGFFGNTADTVFARTLLFSEVEIGGITLQDMYVSTADRVMKIGSAVMEHNSLIINAKKRHLVLLPHDGNTVQYVGNEDKKGLRFVLADKNDTLGVMKAVVRKDGEAYKKGIRTGDYLVSVNGILVTDYCSCRNLFTDSNAKRLVFRTPEGTKKEVEW
jgi:hypothetical protein